MHLLVFSHPCVTPINQEFFAEVEARSGWDLTIVAPAHWNGEYGPRTLERWPRFRGTLHPSPVLFSGNVPLHVYRSTFQSLLRDTQPDAIYVHNEPYAASTAQIHFAHRLSGTSAAFGFYSAQNIAKTYPVPFRWTEQAVYQNSQFAFPCSQTVLDTLRTKGYDGLATQLPLGLDSTLYAPDPDRAALRSELGPNADLLLGYLGRLTMEKGLGTLIDALARLPETLSWRLAMVGKGDDTDELRIRADERGVSDRIHWVGYVEHTEAPRYLSAFDVLLLPSETQPNWKEQFGRVLIEAMACGTPVIGSDSGEIPKVIQDTGGGLTFPEGDASALADRILQLATSPGMRSRLAEQGRETVRREYTHTALADRFIDTISQAVGSAPTTIDPAQGAGSASPAEPSPMDRSR